MAKPQFRMEWASPPEEWASTAAFVFEAALKICYSVAKPIPTGETMVVHLSIFHESARPSCCKGELFDLRSETNLELVAEPVVKSVSQKPLIATCVGIWLRRNNILGKLTSAAVLLQLALYVFSPGRRLHLVEESGSRISMMEHHPLTMATRLLLWIAILFLVLHTLPVDMIAPCMKRFDWVNLVCSSVVHEGVWCLHSVWFSQKYMDGAFGFYVYWSIYAGEVVFGCLGYALLAMTDGLIFLSTRVKAVCLLAYVLTLVRAYYIARWEMKWGAHDWCLNERFCIEPQRLYLAAVMNCIVFGSKLTLCYCNGAEFALLKPQYVRLNNESDQKDKDFFNAWSSSTNTDAPDSFYFARDDSTEVEVACKAPPRCCKDSETQCEDLESFFNTLHGKVQNLQIRKRDLELCNFDLENHNKQLVLCSRELECSVQELKSSIEQLGKSRQQFEGTGERSTHLDNSTDSNKLVETCSDKVDSSRIEEYKNTNVFQKRGDCSSMSGANQSKLHHDGCTEDLPVSMCSNEVYANLAERNSSNNIGVKKAHTVDEWLARHIRLHSAISMNHRQYAVQ